MNQVWQCLGDNSSRGTSFMQQPEHMKHTQTKGEGIEIQAHIKIKG